MIAHNPNKPILTAVAKATPPHPLRPKSLADFVGQAHLKGIIQTSVIASRKENRSFPHTILSGVAGSGKTSLASIISTERNVPQVTTAAEDLKCPEAVRGLMVHLNYDGYDDSGKVVGNISPSVIFLDEVHKLPRTGQELLYTALEDRVIECPVMNPVTGQLQTRREWVPYFTLIVATNRPGDLTTAFKDRFKLHLQLEPYSVAESAMIAERALVRLGMRVGDGAPRMIGERARGIPRKVIALCETIRDVCVARSTGLVNDKICAEAFSALGLDPLGLTRQEVRVLNHLALASGPVGIRTISTLLGEEEKAVESSVEPFLIERHLISRTARGRTITEAGREHLRLHHGGAACA
ncbi:MAG: AAA family ATPase [Planctomycetes bacterium]|nr:AAA family ATPase [Planctomycetota bacterium]